MRLVMHGTVTTVEGRGVPVLARNGSVVEVRLIAILMGRHPVAAVDLIAISLTGFSRGRVDHKDGERQYGSCENSNAHDVSP